LRSARRLTYADARMRNLLLTLLHLAVMAAQLCGHGGVRAVTGTSFSSRSPPDIEFETHMLSMALHSRWMAPRVDTIHTTGGAAINRDILQVMADVFGADVYQLRVGHSAALGAALRAAHARPRSVDELERCCRGTGGAGRGVAHRATAGPSRVLPRLVEN
jgi:hypothetical protein